MLVPAWVAQAMETVGFIAGWAFRRRGERAVAPLAEPIAPVVILVQAEPVPPIPWALPAGYGSQQTVQMILGLKPAR